MSDWQILIDEIPVELPKDMGAYVDAPLIKRESTLRPRRRPRKRIVRTRSYIFVDLETGRVLVLLLGACDAESAP